MATEDGRKGASQAGRASREEPGAAGVARLASGVATTPGSWWTTCPETGTMPPGILETEGDLSTGPGSVPVLGWDQPTAGSWPLGHLDL